MKHSKKPVQAKQEKDLAAAPKGKGGRKKLPEKERRDFSITLQMNKHENEKCMHYYEKNTLGKTVSVSSFFVPVLLKGIEKVKVERKPHPVDSRRLATLLSKEDIDQWMYVRENVAHLLQVVNTLRAEIAKLNPQEQERVRVDFQQVTGLKNSIDLFTQRGAEIQDTLNLLNRLLFGISPKEYRSLFKKKVSN